MTTQAEAALEQPAQRVSTGPRTSLHVLRWVAVLHTLALVIQPVLAGVYLSGDADAMQLHSLNALVVTGLDVIQLACAIVFTWKGRGRSWPIYTSLGIALAVEVQVGVGFERMMAIHVPLGVSIVALQLLLTVWLFRPAAATARQPRQNRVRQNRVRQP